MTTRSIYTAIILIAYSVLILIYTLTRDHDDDYTETSTINNPLNVTYMWFANDLGDTICIENSSQPDVVAMLNGKAYKTKLKWIDTETTKLCSLNTTYYDDTYAFSVTEKMDGTLDILIIRQVDNEIVLHLQNMKRVHMTV